MAGRVVVSAAKQVAKGAVRPRRRRALRAPLNITPAAAEQVKEILSSNEDALGVRLGVKTRESVSFFVPVFLSWLFLSFSARSRPRPLAPFPPPVLSLSFSRFLPSRHLSFSHCSHTHTHTHLTPCSFFPCSLLLFSI